MPLLSTLHGNITAQKLSDFFARYSEKIQDLTLPEFIQEQCFIFFQMLFNEEVKLKERLFQKTRNSSAEWELSATMIFQARKIWTKVT